MTIRKKDDDARAEAAAATKKEMEEQKSDPSADAEEEPHVGEKKAELKKGHKSGHKEHEHHGHSHEHKAEHHEHKAEHHEHKAEHKPYHTANNKKETNYWKIATVILAIAFIITLFAQNMGGPAAKDASNPSDAAADALAAPNPSDRSADKPAAPGALQLADTSGDKEVTLTVVNDPNCAACDPNQVLSVLTGQLFPKTKVVTVDFDSDEGAALIKKYELSVLPSYIYEKAVQDNANYNQIAELMVERGGAVLINPAATGAGKFLNPPDADDDPVLGEEDAPVTIIEFSDFQCPFCKRFYDDAYKQIKEEYVRTGKVKIVFRDFPLSFHTNAQKAAEAGECAHDQGQFWAMHDKIFENQGAISVTDLKRYADDLKLDTKEFNDCLDTGKHANEVKSDMDDGAKGGVSGTPAFFIDGQLISGAQPFAAFKTVIDAALAE